MKKMLLFTIALVIFYILCPLRVPLALAMTLDELYNSPASNIDPNQLAPIFRLGSDYTDLQREDTLEEIGGKVVVWTVPVYEIKRKKDGAYSILSAGDNGLNVEITLTVRSDEEKKYIHSLKTGNRLTIKGVLNGKTFLRALEISPAIIWDKRFTQSPNPKTGYGSLYVTSCGDTGELSAAAGYGEMEDAVYYAPKSFDLCGKVRKDEHYAIKYIERMDSLHGNGEKIRIIQDIRPLYLLKKPVARDKFIFVSENIETDAPYLTAKSLKTNDEYIFAIDGNVNWEKMDNILGKLKEGEIVVISYQPVFVNGFDEQYEYLRLVSISPSSAKGNKKEIDIQKELEELDKYIDLDKSAV